MKLKRIEEIEANLTKEYFLSRRLLERLYIKEHDIMEKMNVLIEKKHRERAEYLKSKKSYEWPTDGHVFFLFVLDPDVIIAYYLEITGLTLDVISEY
jgi:hypothetical protein